MVNNSITLYCCVITLNNREQKMNERTKENERAIEIKNKSEQENNKKKKLNHSNLVSAEKKYVV